jgi:hypothetical protein
MCPVPAAAGKPGKPGDDGRFVLIQNGRELL